MTVFNGNLFTDTVGGTPGTPLNGAVLNALVLVQSSFLVDGGIASSATSANPPVITQPAADFVINSGTACVPKSTVLTFVTCGAGSVAQDNYIDVDSSGVFHVTTGAVGFTPTAVAANALRLYKATTGASNIGVASFTALANQNPLLDASGMLTNGSNAAATVDFAGNFVVGGTTQLTGALTASGNLTVGALTQLDGATIVLGDTTLQGFLRASGSAPALSVSLGTAAGTSPTGPTVVGNANWGTITFTTGTTPPTGTLMTLSCTPAGGQVLLGALISGNFNSGASTRDVSPAAATLSGGTYSVIISVSTQALAAATSYTMSYMLMWL